MDHVAHDEGVVESGRLFKVAAGELISLLEQVGYQLVVCGGPLLKFSWRADCAATSEQSPSCRVETHSRLSVVYSVYSSLQLSNVGASQ
jgi:hypothetical protein